MSFSAQKYHIIDRDLIRPQGLTSWLCPKTFGDGLTYHTLVSKSEDKQKIEFEASKSQREKIIPLMLLIPLLLCLGSPWEVLRCARVWLVSAQTPATWTGMRDEQKFP